MNRSGGRPLLLDQATSHQLVRRAAEGDTPTGPAAPGRRRRPAGGQTRRQRLRRLLLGTLTPASLLVLSVASTIGVVSSTAHTVAQHHGVTPADAARIVIMGFALLTIFGQATSILRSNPLGRRVLALVGRPVSGRRPPVPEPALAPVAALLDQLSADELLAIAQPDLGNGSAIVVAAHQSWRSVDTALWVIVSGAAVVLAGAVTVSLVVSLASSISSGNLALSTALTGLFTALSSFGLFLMTRSAIRTLLNRRRRRRRPALLRLLRYLLRLIRGDSPGRALGAIRLAGGSTFASFVILWVAVATVAGAGYGPELLQLDAGGASTTASATPGAGSGGAAGGGLGSPATPTVSPAGGGGAAGASPGGASSPGASGATPAPGSPPASAAPGSTPVATPTGPSPIVTATAPTGTSVPTTTPTATPAPTPTPSPTPSPSPTPAPTPAPTPTPTINPALDSDGDGVPDVIEIQYGSNPYSAASTPENWHYDAAFNAGTCSDGIDNDGNGLIDANGGVIGNTQVGPDPKCLP